VGGAGTAVPSLGDDLAVGIENDATHLRVYAPGWAEQSEFERATHRGLKSLVAHWAKPLEDLMLRGGEREGRAKCAQTQGSACAKNANAKPSFFSHPDFNRRCWNFTSSTA
jgi:hypothetical protein